MDTGRAKPSEGKDDIANMVELITKIGPDIPEIARRIGRHKETVRYWYKEKLLEKGFAVQPIPDYKKLALERIIMVIEFGEGFETYAQPILWAMNELCYVVHFEKTLPKGSYIVHANVPREYSESFVQFMSKLEKKGLLKSLQLSPYDLHRNIPMRAELYDFDNGRWDFDWSKSTALKPEDYNISQKEDYDHLDLLILEQFQTDANKTLEGIATALKVNYKTLAWHFNKHVVGRQLIKGYKINWMGTRYDFKIDKAMHRSHRYVRINLISRDVTDYERMSLMTKFLKLPFIWAEAIGRNYYIEFAFPTESINEALQYLEMSIVPVRDKTELYIMDQTAAMNFTITAKLHDPDEERWQFNQEELLAKFDALILKIKEGT
jgi:hypothetical protein